jgi:hypothetical protein
LGVLFEKGRSTITEHLQNIFDTGELKEISVCRDFRHTAEDGKEYTTKFYNLDVIIAVGFRVNSERGTQFRQWATKLNVFLRFNNRELLANPGKVTQEIAKAFAESEFEKYRIVQDRLFESDFDKMIKKLKDKGS